MCLMLGTLLLVLGCTTRRPVPHESIQGVYEHASRHEALVALKNILIQDSIPIRSFDLKSGTIVSDSFEAAPRYCDCGRNFFGAEYPGTRRGVMRIKASGGQDFRVKFEFSTLLTITANNKQVHCTSFGILEGEILAALDSTLGMKRVNAVN